MTIRRLNLSLLWLWLSLLAARSPLACPGETGSLKALSVLHQAVGSQFHVDQYTLQDLELVGTAQEYRVSLLLAGQQHQIVLRRHALRAAGFHVVVQEANGRFREVEVPEPLTYRGYVAGFGGSSVSASIKAGRIRAIVSLGIENSSTWVIEPIEKLVAGAAPGQHLVYSSADVVTENGVCGNQDAPVAKAAGPPTVESEAGALDVLVCRIACDADYEYYALNGSSVTNTVADIETIVNGVSAIYERDAKISFQLTQILVRSVEPNPYSATTVDGLLSQFRTDWRNNHQDIPRDIAHLFTGKSFGSVLGNSYTDQVCPAFNHYSLVRSRWQTDLGKRIALSAHEIGHSFDAVHCDYDSDPRCRIMCSNLGGCSNGYHSFEELNIARIRAAAAAATCLTAGAVETPTTSLPFADDFNTVTYPPQAPDPAKWTAADLAECQYRHLEISIGRDYNYNQKLGTVRTLPMRLSGPAKLQYKVNCSSIPSSQSLRIEYFDSSSFSWQLLRTILGDGSSQYRSYEDAVPASAAGDWFAVRFSAYATTYSASYRWALDDVSIVQAIIAPQLSILLTTTNTVMISWPQSALDWILEASDRLTSATNNWTTIVPPYPTNATQCVITDPLPPGNRFYRLRAP